MFKTPILVPLAVLKTLIVTLIGFQISEASSHCANFAEFPNFVKNQPKSVLTFQNSNFGPNFEYLPIGIIKKCLLGTFSNLEVVSNSTKFSNFGHMKSEIRFFKD